MVLERAAFGGVLAMIQELSFVEFMYRYEQTTTARHGEKLSFIQE
ncbi:hypothetical protein [Methanolobus sp.]|nr:hypothetical protein [Methanolobus sp.]